MVAHVELIKTDLGTYGEGWELVIGDIENPEMPRLKIKVSEYVGEQAIKSFKNCEQSGKHFENARYF